MSNTDPNQNPDVIPGAAEGQAALSSSRHQRDNKGIYYSFLRRARWYLPKMINQGMADNTVANRKNTNNYLHIFHCTEN